MLLVGCWLMTSEKEGKGMSFVPRTGMGFKRSGGEKKNESRTPIRNCDRVDLVPNEWWASFPVCH